MPDVLIFDDDPSVGDLAGELLRSMGLTVGHYLSGAGILELIQEGRPRLVVLDIMMPGLDGISACRAIRASPAARGVRIAVITAKQFRQDREMAKRYGADLFMQKPFEPEEFARSVAGLLGLDAPRRGPAPPPAPPMVVQCLAAGAVVQTPELWILLDAGEGLWAWLQAQGKAPPACWLLLSRYDPEATADIGACALLLKAGSKIKVAGPDDPGSSLQQLAPRISSAAAGATPLLYPQREGEFQLAAGAHGRTQYTHHPGLTLAYRLELHGRRLVYCPAHELDGDPKSWHGHEVNKFRSFVSGADLLLHGFKRSLGDPKPALGEAGCAWEPVVDLAAESKIAHLALLPGPGAPPAQETARVRLSLRGSPMRCAVARPGERIVL